MSLLRLLFYFVIKIKIIQAFILLYDFIIVCWVTTYYLNYKGLKFDNKTYSKQLFSVVWNRYCFFPALAAFQPELK